MSELHTYKEPEALTDHTEIISATSIERIVLGDIISGGINGGI
jgi:hypothetical protein